VDEGGGVPKKYEAWTAGSRRQRHNGRRGRADIMKKKPTLYV
jgi:hypothetical protein